MMLRELNAYLAERKRASLTELAEHFGADAAALRGMLAMLIAKKRVERERTTCGGCVKCGPEQTEVYRWRETR